MDTALDGLESPSMAERPLGVPEEVRAHFDACPACRGQWQLLSRAEVALRAPRIVPAPAGMLAEFHERLAAEARHAEHRPSNPFSRWLWPMGSLAAAGMAAAFMLTMNVQGQFARRDSEPAVAGAPSPRSPSSMSVARKSDSLQLEKSGAPRQAFGERRERPSQAEPRTARVESGMTALENKFGESEAARAPIATEQHELRKTTMAIKPATVDVRVNSLAAAPDKAKRDFEALALTRDAKARPQTKSIVEARDSYLKQNVEMKVASAGAAFKGGAGGLGGGLGGFGGNPASAASLAEATPGVPSGVPAPAAFKAKADVAERGARPEGLAVLALEERESLIAAEVSPALVTALQRPVSLDKRGPENVLTVLGRLSREADIEVQLEGKATQLALSLQSPVKSLQKDELRQASETQVPLWVALQSVALQGKLQIIPEENRLVLRPIDAKAMKAVDVALNRRMNRLPAAPKLEARDQNVPGVVQADKPSPLRAAGESKPVPATEPQALRFAGPQQAANVYYLAYRALPNPDPRVWPSMWGDLPKWLFTLPEERPEAVQPEANK